MLFVILVKSYFLLYFFIVYGILYIVLGHLLGKINSWFCILDSWSKQSYFHFNDFSPLSLWCRPIEHNLQVFCPSSSWYVPASQSSHDNIPVSFANVPVAHLLHSSLPMGRNRKTVTGHTRGKRKMYDVPQLRMTGSFLETKHICLNQVSLLLIFFKDTFKLI